jgi:hypothetical protein
MRYDEFLNWRKDADCYLYDVCDFHGKKLCGAMNYYDTIQFCNNKKNVLIYVN